ncbi:MAG: TolC family protein [Candidatus Gygaella obscura]|nr:TolC family protein [Candidatus Gygaella obscura]
MKNKTVFIIVGLLLICNISFSEEAVIEKILFELSLADVSRIAIENNLDIQIAKYDAYIKRTDDLSSRSIYDTIFSASASYKNDELASSSSLAAGKTTTRDYGVGVSKKTSTGTTIGVDLENQRVDTDSSLVSINPSNEASAKFSLKQELGKNFFGLKDRSDIKITKFEILNSDYTSLDKIEDVLLSVQKAYWKLAYLYEELEVRKDMLKKAKKLMTIYDDKYTLGLVEDPDLFAARANVLSRKNELNITKKQLELANSNLLLRLNEENEALDVLTKDKIKFKVCDVDLNESLEQAVLHRRDYARGKNNIKAKNINLVMKKNNLWPEIDLSASLAKNGIDSSYSEALSSINKSDNKEFYVGLTIKIPFENSNARAQLSKARLEKAKYLASLKQIERKILIEINDKITILNSLLNQVDTSVSIVDLQQQKLAAEEDRFNVGRSSSDILIRYQEDLLNARLSLVGYIYEYELAKIDLLKSEGVLLNEYVKGEVL